MDVLAYWLLGPCIAMRFWYAVLLHVLAVGPYSNGIMDHLLNTGAPKALLPSGGVA